MTHCGNCKYRSANSLPCSKCHNFEYWEPKGAPKEYGGERNQCSGCELRKEIELLKNKVSDLEFRLNCAVRTW